MDAVAEVKSRLNIEDVVAEYVQLKRSGRNFKGLSPWTNEKSASFIVSPEKGIWHDFSSGRGGDVLSFVMEMEGLDFKGALEQLARKAGVDLEQFRGQTSSANTQHKGRVLETLELAAHFYQKQLLGSQSALSYLLKDRGFSKQTLLDWRLGYAPNTGQALVNFLAKRGFSADDIKRAGLSFQRREGMGDMFRGRIMIPLCDARGSVVGFTARLLADEPDAPKYINTPATVVYDKSRQVFGLHLAKEAIRKSGFVVVAEGNLDVIQSYQAGVKNVVASAGTAMTEQHLRELKRFTGDIRLSFDADRAGITATERVIPLAQKTGVELRIISLPDAKDPDELIRKDVGAWQQAIEKAQEAPDWLIDRYQTELDLTTAAGKKTFTDALIATIRSLTDPVEQEHYLKRIAGLADSSLEAVRAKLGGNQSGQPATPRKLRKIDPAKTDKTALEYQKLQDHFLAMLMMQPKLRGLLENLEAELFSDGPARAVFSFLGRNSDFTGEATKVKELKEVADYVKIISLQFEELYQSLSLADLEEQAKGLKHRLIDRYVKMQKQDLAATMQTTTSQSEMDKLVKKADKLNQFINSN